nr:endonuclease/exonuclease/phosphatase family protein [Kribbella sandramycini]
MTVASLNTRGTPLLSSQLSSRYAALGAAFEAAEVDVVNLQEVWTHYHLWQLIRAMPSYRFTSFRRSLAGPAGGLLTLSRLPVVRTRYHRLSALKGVLATALPGVTVANTHLLANRDGDWSESNRYYSKHQAQLAALSRVLPALEPPLVLSGDFNLARDSSLYGQLVRAVGLVDAFGADCPPTFHAAYLPPGRTPHCIDYAFVTSSMTVDVARLNQSLPSDHLGLEVRIHVDSVG